MPLAGLNAEGAQTRVFFFNPNIHPYTEWKKRRETLAAHCEREGAALLPASDYEVSEWFRAVAFRENQRCRLCYYLRLRETAKVAKKGKFDCFTTSLLYSRYQKHDLIREAGEEVSKEYDLPFLYRDWRVDWEEGVRRSRELSMYRQPYCGCLYSETERYREKGGPK
jgi:predicted adenine nucleotide alpha hydrolase (AANH) superfamily ATPase